MSCRSTQPRAAAFDSLILWQRQRWCQISSAHSLVYTLVVKYLTSICRRSGQTDGSGNVWWLVKRSCYIINIYATETPSAGASLSLMLRVFACFSLLSLSTMYNCRLKGPPCSDNLWDSGGIWSSYDRQCYRQMNIKYKLKQSGQIWQILNVEKNEFNTPVHYCHELHSHISLTVLVLLNIQLHGPPMLDIQC